MKQVASHFGGTRNAMVMKWPDRITEVNSLRNQFHHVIDIAPTILAAAGLKWPETVNGIEQMPVDGVSMEYSFNDADALSARKTQYFEIFGNRAIFHEGWIASCFHGRVPWIRLKGYEFGGDQEKWELYNVDEDFSQSEDLSDIYPDKLTELQNLFATEAVKHNVFPLRDTSLRISGNFRVPSALGKRKRMSYTTDHVRIPESAVINLKNVSHRISSKVTVPSEGAQGVIACQGGNMSGWSLYFDSHGKPTYHYNCFGQYLTTIRAEEPLEDGDHEILIDYQHDGGFGAGGLATLYVDGEPVNSGRIARTVPIIFSMSGETFDVGVDTGAPVGPYPHGYPFSGEIHEVVLERMSRRDRATRSKMNDGLKQAGLRSQ